MYKEFIPYEQALELKELGFNENCLAFYNFEERLMPIDTDFTNFRELSDDLIKAPLYQQAFRWFRDKYDLDSYILCTYIGVTSQKNNEYSFAIQHCDDYDYFVDADRYTYEEAELACFKKLIEIAKNK